MNKDTVSKQAVRETLLLYRHLIVSEWQLTIPVAAAVAIGTTLIFYIPPLVIASIISDTSNGGAISLANGWRYLLLFGGAWLTGEMLWRLAFFFLQRFETRALNWLYNFAVQDLLQKDITFFYDHFAGSITKNTIGFARRFESFFDTIIFEIVSNVFPAIFALIVLAFISPFLSLALLIMVIAGGLIARPLIIRRTKLVRIREEKHSTLAGHVSDIITNIGVVKAYGHEKVELHTHEKHVRHFTDAAYNSWRYHNERIAMVVSPIYVATNVVGLAIILMLGVSADTKAQLFLAFNYYATFSRFMWSFNDIYRRLEESIAEAALFTQYTLTKPTIVDQPSATVLAAQSGLIEFHNISFAHDSARNNTLFEGLNLSIQAGSRVGLVGHSGAGKTSLVNLLERFNNTDKGSIIIDGQDISETTQESLHHAIAYVPQEPLLFHRSLRDNIAYGRPDAHDDEIHRAAKQANALDFIKQLPQGFDTLVGERGVKLSGGQRQRIAIARAILKDAPILVLDEATSALDSESEKLIQASLDTLMKGRTSIVIAHRLSTIAKLDRIIVLEQGKIIEDGTHADLLKKNGTYAKLWNHQSGGFIEE